MKQSLIIGQGVNNNDSVTDVENKTPVELAVATTEAECKIVDQGIADALVTAFAEKLGVTLPVRTTRTARREARYKFAPRELANAGREIVNTDGFSQYKGEVNPELLTMTLYSYVNRIFRINRTITPKATVFYQLLNNILAITETKEIACNDWLQQRDYLKEKVSQHSKAWIIMQSKDGGLWIAVFGKRGTLLIHKMQEFNIAMEATI